MTTRIASFGAVAIAGLTLTACSTDSAPQDAAQDATIDIVASTSVWGDVVSAVVTDGGEVSAIVEDSAIDPHSFEPSATDLAKGMEADMVVVGGGGYDAWLYEPLVNDGKEDKIVHALPLVAHSHDHGDHDHAHGEEGHDHSHDAEGHDHDHAHGEEGHDHSHDAEGHDHDHAHEHGAESEGHEGHNHEHAIETVDGNEHIWFDVDAVSAVAEDIATAAKEKSPEAKADAKPVTTRMDDLRTRLEALPHAKVAQTETIGDYLIDDSHLEDVTPDSYRQAALNHASPSAADLAAFLDKINNGEVDVLLYNPQTETDLTKRVHDAAVEKGVKIVEIGEVAPEGVNFLDYFEQVVSALEEATK
ncbi:metal ABC transporter solute-binding protein, Zn/Mn family [Corynebacterium tapiri]|nr:zinc ABC transporter substrate-binding protein [Corynebacterium tapiri]